MIDSVNSTSASSQYASSSSSSSSLSSNYDMFLQLLTTQLQTQNPLDPMDTTEFTSQLATYSAVEQQVQTNSKLDDVIAGLSALSMGSGIGYLGHTVEAATDTLSVGTDGGVDASWKYTLDSAADTVELTIVDADGNTVWRGTGETGAGSHALDWDGTDGKGNAVPAGDYTLQVSAVDAADSEVAASVSIRGTVTAIDSSDGSAMVELGDTRVALGDVTRLTS